MDNRGKLFVISGPSGVGKNTVIERFLINNPTIKLSISNTTRSPRGEEVDGVNYFFIEKETFLKAVENNEFLEWAEFSGNYYGTKQAYVEKTLAKGNNLILEIDVKGALQIKKKIPEAILIFIAPPSIKALEERLRGRKTETEDAIQKRLAVASYEMEISKNFDYTVVNDNIDAALKDFQVIFDKYR